MNPWRHLAVILSRAKARLARKILIHRVLYRNPTLVCDPTAIWDYGYSDLDAIRIGKNVVVRAFAEIIVYKTVGFSSIHGGLTLGDRVLISRGVNLRAAGGEIHIGANSSVSPNSLLFASTHVVQPGKTVLYTPWDESRSGIRIGQNVWIGAACVIMPGVEIGDNAVVGAGSVVTKSIPSNEIWAGTPARFLKNVSG